MAAIVSLPTSLLSCVWTPTSPVAFQTSVPVAGINFLARRAHAVGFALLLVCPPQTHGMALCFSAAPSGYPASYTPPSPVPHMSSLSTFPGSTFLPAYLLLNLLPANTHSWPSCHPPSFCSISVWRLCVIHSPSPSPQCLSQFVVHVLVPHALQIVHYLVCCIFRQGGRDRHFWDL